MALYWIPASEGDARMSWVRIDDQFARHPKVMQAGPLAGWLYVAGLCYASQYLTDGFIPHGAVPTLADFSHISYETGGVPGLFSAGEDADPRDLAACLAEVGLWEPVEGGYRIHDYLDYNPSAEEVRAQRRQSAERQARWRGQRHAEAATPSLEVRHAGSNGVTNAESNGRVGALVLLPPSPTPSPTPTDQETPDHLVEGVQGEQPTKAPRKARGKPAQPPCSDAWMAIIRDVVPKPSAIGLKRLAVRERSESPPGPESVRAALRRAIDQAADDPCQYAAGILRSNPEYRYDGQTLRRTGTDGHGGRSHRASGTEIWAEVAMGRRTREDAEREFADAWARAQRGEL